MQYDSGSSAGHAWVSPYGTVSCSATASPFLNDCGTDPQNAFLRKLFGSVNGPNTGAAERCSAAPGSRRVHVDTLDAP